MSRLLRSAPGTPDTTLTFKIASILLQYPGENVWPHLDPVAASIPAIKPRETRAAVARFLEWLTTVTATEAAQHYVEIFDHTRYRSLYLTYYRHGDTRARGMALLALKRAYREAGYPAPDSELPDFLPLMLEFATLAPEPGRRVLLQCRAGLELLAEALHEAESPYAHLLEAVRAPLPPLHRRQLEKLRAVSAEGPPTEHVGLEPFAPPEFLTGQHL